MGGQCEDIADVGLGTSHACALLASGKVFCWGGNGSGQLGNGVVQWDSQSIGPAVSLGGKAIGLGVSFSSSFAVMESGEIYGWGANLQGELGVTGPTLMPDKQVPLGTPAIAVSSRIATSCALLQSHDVRCWGLAPGGRLGNPNLQVKGQILGDDEPLDQASLNVALGGSKVTHLSTSNCHSCVVLEGGGARCWGCNQKGQLGYGNTETLGDNEAPSQDIPLGGRKAKQIVALHESTCVLLEEGDVRCWGANNQGQLGYGDTLSRGNLPGTTPDKLPAVPLGPLPQDQVLQLAAGYQHVCALLAGGRVRCWGDGAQGKLGQSLGDLSLGDNESVAGIGDVELGGKALKIFVGPQNSCALLENGRLRCWGHGFSQILGFDPKLVGLGASVGDDEVPKVAPFSL